MTDDEVLDDFIILVEGSTLLSLVDGLAEESRADRLDRHATAFVDQLRAPAG